MSESPVTPLFEARAISRSFPGCLANDAIDFAVGEGEIHALLGENGAGKSTLVKIIYGVIEADSGTLSWQGAAVPAMTPAHARRLGIGMVFQHFSLFEQLTVLENIALTMDGERDMRRLTMRLDEVAEAYGLPLDAARHVYQLSVGERQRIEIVRCLLQNPKLLILDEPTSVLTPQEADRLFETLVKLSGEGCAVLYISHKLDEVRRLCHRATILREGRVVGTCDPRGETAAAIAEMMIGEKVIAAGRPGGGGPGPQRLEVRGLSLGRRGPGDPGIVEFQVRGGEILGIAGIAGNGQKELMAALTGEAAAPKGTTIAIDGAPVTHLGPWHRRRRAVGFVPETRLGHAAVADLNLIDNAFIAAGPKAGLSKAGWIEGAAARRFADAVIERFDVRCQGADADAGSLSGGNLQKFIVGREILQDPGVLIVQQPTWGVDPGAAAAIHQALMDLAAGGAAVLVISQDLDELLAISDRIAVLSEGRLSPPRAIGEVDIEGLGLLMGGLHDLEDRPC